MPDLAYDEEDDNLFDYFEMVGDSFVIFDVDKFREKTKALAIDLRAEGLFILNEETMTWDTIPVTDLRRKTHLKPVT
jgi:hypothetical protein